MSVTKNIKDSGEAVLERLPAELLRRILVFITVPNHNFDMIQSSKLNYNMRINELVKPAPNLLPCLLTSHHLYGAALSVTYRDLKVSLPETLSSILAQLRLYPDLGIFVRSLELSDKMCTAAFLDQRKLGNTLHELIRLTPLLRNFKIGGSFQSLLDAGTLKMLFCKLKLIESIDFSECHSPSFALELMSLCNDCTLQVSSSIRNISLRGCKHVPPSIFAAILPQLHRLQFLDLENTQIPPDALIGLAITARLTHLNINNCDLLSGTEISDFLTNHPAATSTLVSLEAVTSQDVPGLDENEVTAILNRVPPTLRSLILKNSHMSSKHLPLLLKFSRQLTELTVGSHLSLRDIESLFIVPNDFESEDSPPPSPPVELKHRTVLGPLEEAVAICKLRSQINIASFSELGSSLRYLDLSGLRAEEQQRLTTSVLLGTGLDIIEISDTASAGFAGLGRLWMGVGWEMRSEGQKCWLQRKS